MRDALPVRVDEWEVGNERVSVEERDDDHVVVLERVADCVAVLDRAVALVAVDDLLGVRDVVAACDGVWLDDGVPAGVGSRVRVPLAPATTPEPTKVGDADAGCVRNAVRVGDDVTVRVRVPDGDGVCDGDGVDDVKEEAMRRPWYVRPSTPPPPAASQDSYALARTPLENEWFGTSCVTFVST